MSDIVLQVENLGKCFKIYRNPWDRAREWISPRQQYHQPFWSLRNVSFQVRRGEFLGIMGENGAGKSTLLKIITGVLKPTEGSYRLEGKVLSLLELGTDFNFELSGRSNAIYSAELLGFPPGFVQSRLQAIEAFSELGEFFDRPMKLYSSGMKARLAFSLFAFLDCDVLILDEVLAVGDIFFQQKCYARLEALIKRQVTIILVTHQLDSVQQYCKEAILLHQGQKLFQGEPRAAIIQFHQLRRGTLNSAAPAFAPTKPVATTIEEPQAFFGSVLDVLFLFQLSCAESRNIFHRVKSMVLEPIHCPACDGIDVIKHGTTAAGKQRYRCQKPECSRISFIREYSYQGYLPNVKRQISDMAINGSGIRDTARVLGISPTTVIEELKKRSALASGQ